MKTSPELPEWFQEMRFSSKPLDRGQIDQLMTALSIALEFITDMSKGNRYPRTLEKAKDALRRIEELGK